MAVKVGTFQKVTDAAPVQQVVTGVGFRPRALLMWSPARTALGSWSAHLIQSIGMTDGNLTRCSGGAVENGLNALNAVGWWSNDLLKMVDHNKNVLGAASLVSLDADGFTLNWTANDANAYYIHYLALAGVNLTNVKMVEWTCTTGAGNVSVTGVGFQPDLVIHLSSFQGSAAVVDSSRFSIGAMTAAAQWVIGASAYDTSTFSYVRLVQNDDMCLASDDILAWPELRLARVSLDADGFTVQKVSPPTSEYLVASLCLKGSGLKLGYYELRNNPGSQAVTGVGFRPEGLLFLDGGYTGETTGNIGLCMSLGAVDGVSQCVGTAEAPYSDNPNIAGATSRTNVCMVTHKWNSATALQDYDRAALTSLDADGFTLDVQLEEDSPNRIGYIAFGTGAAPKGLRLLPILGAGI